MSTPPHRKRKSKAKKKLQHSDRVALLIANSQGEVFEHPTLEAVLDDGIAPRPATPLDMIPLPKGWEIMHLPSVRPLGFDRETGRVEVLESCDLGDGPFVPQAVAIHPPPSYVRSHFPGAKYLDLDEDGADPNAPRPGLPLWGFTAVGDYEGHKVAALFQGDELSRWDPPLYNLPELGQGIAERLQAHPDNAVLQQLSKCSKDYNCHCSQNIFYGRWEGALPIAPSCNAACLGCLSREPEWDAPVPQYRLRVAPSSEDIAEVIVDHLERADEGMISFGQGCEGEPTMRGDDLVNAIALARQKTSRGVINLNTNGSKPDVVERCVKAGLGALRVSINTFDEKVFNKYYRPHGFSMQDCIQSLRVAHNLGAYTSINFLLWPGWTDRVEEMDAISALVDEGILDMVQLRNLCVDPQHYNALLPKERGRRLGMRGFVLELAARHPQLRFGTFNPRLGTDWYEALPKLPEGTLMPSFDFGR